MYGRFTRAFVLCAISAGAVAACSSKGERAAVDSARAAAPATDTAAHAAAPAAAAPAASASDDIKAAENSWRIALVSGDTVTLGKLTATEFTMPREYTVPSKTEKASIRYQNFVVDTNFEEDKWIQAAECKPGNRAVVHHIIVYVVSPQGFKRENHKRRVYESR